MGTLFEEFSAKLVYFKYLYGIACEAEHFQPLLIFSKLIIYCRGDTTPTIKELILKWGNFEKAKPIFRILLDILLNRGV